MSAQPNKSASNNSAHPLRAISFGNPAVTVDRRADGTIYLRPKAALGDYPVRVTDRLHYWAAATPDRKVCPRLEADSNNDFEALH